MGDDVSDVPQVRWRAKGENVGVVKQVRVMPMPVVRGRCPRGIVQEGDIGCSYKSAPHDLIVPQDREPRCRVWCVDCRGLSRGMPMHMHCRQERVHIQVELLEDGRSIEPINKVGRAP